MNNKILNNDIYKFFIEKINKNAPLIIPTNTTLEKDIEEILNKKAPQIKYPYKPFLILSIINVLKNNKEFLFKKNISLFDDEIIKNFYDLVTNDYLLFNILKGDKSKKTWELGFNKKVMKSVFSIMLQGPIRYLESKWFKYNKENKSVKFYFEINNYEQDFNYLESLCYVAIKKSIPWYKFKDNKEIANILEYEYSDLITNGIVPTYSEYQNRKYQHIFRKIVLDRDGKCLICCIENSKIIQACHIKPYKDSNEIEKYDFNNGITLCSNHHILFDNGLFSFDENWNIKISKEINEFDDDLFFRQYDNCHKKTLIKFSSSNDYTKFHYSNIFIK